jgi:tetratricopeptide (TPR) repeat protein
VALGRDRRGRRGGRSRLLHRPELDGLQPVRGGHRPGARPARPHPAQEARQGRRRRRAPLVIALSDRLRPLWNFSDLDATEQRLRGRLEQETDDAGRAEVLTQLARVEGLRDDFDTCEQLLEQADALAGSSAVARVRIDLERGRKLRSSGNPEAALPLFEAAFAKARAAGEHYLAGDAAHMCALAVAGNRAAMEEWTQRGLDLGEREPAAAYWAGPLLNNLGWSYFDAGDPGLALELFERALEIRRRDPENQDAISLAEEAVQTARDALG